MKNKIKEDLLELYKIMVEMISKDVDKKYFSRDLHKLTKHSIADVQSALINESEKNARPIQEVRQEIIDLKSANDAVSYFKNIVWQGKEADLESLVNDFSLNELKLIYFKIMGIEIVPKKASKSVIVSKIVDYINSEIRTEDLAKDLY